MSFTICIPARYGSKRLPGKPLLKIGKKTIIHRVYEKCLQTSADRILIATDDSRIVEEVESFGGQACLTKTRINSGSERVAAAMGEIGLPDETILVNVQGDEPFVSPKVIEQIASGVCLHRESVNTACEVVDIANSLNPNIVKVVRDFQKKALYFSRSRIPWMSSGEQLNAPIRFLKHIGIYGYSLGLLKNFVASKTSPAEQSERLEQLRFLHFGIPVIVHDAVDACGVGIDTLEDYQEACAKFEK